jgi:hypothetical protein
MESAAGDRPGRPSSAYGWRRDTGGGPAARRTSRRYSRASLGAGTARALSTRSAQRPVNHSDLAVHARLHSLWQGRRIAFMAERGARRTSACG